ncbi:hypothetical protein ACFYU9_23780 [Streptomyces sp. NPDC004327]|uniref:hypothetical protein n=1 Tax=unclassified Streptomyces TaxID=2593676 RepID=UPI00369F48B0
MSNGSVTEARVAGRRAPAVLPLLLLFALVALIAGVCHGAHGHALPLAADTAGTSVEAPLPAHGCERPGEGWSFDAHLPAQVTGTQLSAPSAGGAVLVPHDEVFPAHPRARCVRDRAGPGPEPGSLLVTLGVNRN